MTVDFKTATTRALCNIALSQRSRFDQDRWLQDLVDQKLIRQGQKALLMDGERVDDVIKSSEL